MKEITKADELIINFIDKNKNVLFLVLISILALLIRNIFKDFRSVDYNNFLMPWCSYLEMNGGFKSLATIDSDYNFIYLYILTFFTYIPGTYLIKIKILSVIFDYLAAFGAYLIVMETLKSNENRKVIAAIVYSAVLFLPTVIMNGAVWGQCDIIYSTFIIFSIYFILKNKNSAAFIFYGIALTLKLQAIFILPVYLILYLKNKNFSILNFLWIPVINILLYIPALIIGKPLRSILSAYFKQAGEYPNLVLNYSNIYNLIPSDNQIIGQAGIIFTMILIGSIAFFIISSIEKIEGEEIVHLSALMILIAVYFLPHMHERYAFCGELLLVIYYILKRKNIIIPTIMIFIVINNYLNFLCNYSFIESKVIASLIQLIIIIIIFSDFLKENELNMSLNCK